MTHKPNIHRPTYSSRKILGESFEAVRFESVKKLEHKWKKSRHADYTHLCVLSEDMIPKLNKMQTFASPGRRVFYINLIVVVFVSLLSLIVMAASTGEATSEAKVHIIYTEKPTDEEPKDYHLRTLSSALGRSVIEIVHRRLTRETDEFRLVSCLGCDDFAGVIALI